MSYLTGTGEFLQQIFGFVHILRIKSNCSLSKPVPEGKKSYVYSICNHPFCKQSYFKNHVVAVHAFSENQTDELNFHYRSLVLSNSKVKIWQLTFKSCLCMFFKKLEPKNVALELFDRHRWIFTSDLWFCPNFKVKI